jgi:phosphinothricin acetyltransferase
MSAVRREAKETTTADALQVRRPIREDLPALREIYNWAIGHTAALFKTEPETHDDWIRRWDGRCEKFPWFVAEWDGAVVGFAIAAPFLGSCGCPFAAEVSVYVGPDHQGVGVGKALYGQLIPTLAAQGYRTAVAVTALPNPASERLHEEFGFRRVGLLTRVGWKFDRWHDVGHWQLMLGDNDGTPHPIKPVAEVLRPTTGEQ